MTWINQRAEPDNNDEQLLRFLEAKNELCRISKHEQSCKNCFPIGGEHCIRLLYPEVKEDLWDNWISGIEGPPAPSINQVGEDDGPTSQTAEDFRRMNLIMVGRTSSLSRMPFSTEVFKELMIRMKIHRSIIRAINRNTSCTFSRIISEDRKSSIKSIVYTCRTVESWDNDMALSVTFFPDTLTTNAIWFGCNLKNRLIDGHALTDSAIIKSRLREFDGEVFHPMMLPTIFAEFERNRHVNLVRKSNTQFVQRMIDLESRNDMFYGILQTSRGTRQTKEENSVPSRANTFFNKMKGRVGSFLSGTTISVSSTFHNSDEPDILQNESDLGTENEGETCAMLWIKISHLKNGLENWKTQLRKMFDHTQELEEINFGMNCGISTEVSVSRQDSLKECGKRITERLRELIDEYDDFIRECDHIMAGMLLATQLDLSNIGRKDARLNENISRSSLAVAETAQRDGNLMKSIAILGMIYLPATFVCTFFSMGFFQWREQSDSTTTVSPDLWIFGLSAGAFTLLTVGIFLVCTMNRRSRTANRLHMV
ncbi:hypothetical protein V8C35DRAFT_259805 [Trichoderma chlorosporum]